MASYNSIVVIGAGAWGTALASVAARAGRDVTLYARNPVPAQNLREAVTALAPHLATATPVVACAKGIERSTHKFMTEVIAETAPEAVAGILSGPSFADDVARGLPTAVTLASVSSFAASVTAVGRPREG